MPDLHIIMGSNGAGKSSVGRAWLPPHIQQDCSIFDGDKLFWNKIRELYKKETPSIKEAKRIALDWLFEHFELLVSSALEQKKDFVYEGHLPENENWATPARFANEGYKIHVIYFGLADTALSGLRVFERAKLGGHNVPAYEIERNFYGNLIQLNKRFNFIDELKIIDTSEAVPKVIAIFNTGKVETAIEPSQIPDWFKNELSALYNIILNKK
jgi:predicted ABC-type ATPase